MDNIEGLGENLGDYIINIVWATVMSMWQNVVYSRQTLGLTSIKWLRGMTVPCICLNKAGLLEASTLL